MKKLGVTTLASGKYEGNAKGWIKSDISSLNRILGGGLPHGRLIEIYGAEAGGKTSFGLEYAAQLQKTGGIVVFIDAEHSASPAWFANLGVDISNMLYIQSTPEMPLALEDVYEKIEKIVKLLHEKHPKTPVLVIWDSATATPSRARLNGAYGDSLMADAARANSQGLQKLIQVIGSTNCCLLIINQMRDGVGPYAGGSKPTGGKAFKFYASIRIKASKSYGVEYKNEITGEIIGHGLEFYVEKNKVGIPYRRAKIDMFFDSRGLDGVNSVYHSLNELKILLPAGSAGKKLILPGGTELKFKLDDWRKIYEENKEVIDHILEEYIDDSEGETKPPDIPEEQPTGVDTTDVSKGTSRTYKITPAKKNVKKSK